MHHPSAAPVTGFLVAVCGRQNVTRVLNWSIGFLTPWEEVYGRELQSISVDVHSRIRQAVGAGPVRPAVACLLQGVLA